jgi:predicted transposase YdaD
MHTPYDRSSKWLIEHHGDAILRLGGVGPIRSWRAVQTELVQPKQIPDGLLEVQFADRAAESLFLIEISTYPKQANYEQALRDAVFVYVSRQRLPELLTVVLRPEGNKRVTGTHVLTSPEGWTQLRLKWRVVKLWTLPARQLLDANDIGMVPWVPLTKFREPPEVVLQECRRRIDEQAPANERANFLAVTQVMSRLRYNSLDLMALFGGREAMIESPLIQELLAEEKHGDILRVLTDRFGAVPPAITTSLRSIQDVEKLRGLMVWASRCPDMDAFHSRLSP